MSALTNNARSQSAAHAGSPKSIHVLVDVQHGSTIAAAVAVIWGRKERQRVSPMAPVVSIHDKLVGAAHRVERVLVVPVARNILAEREAGSTRTWACAQTPEKHIKNKMWERDEGRWSRQYPRQRLATTQHARLPSHVKTRSSAPTGRLGEQGPTHFGTGRTDSSSPPPPPRARTSVHPSPVPPQTYAVKYSPQPAETSSGSDHNRSHMIPSSGGSRRRSISFS